jgi:uncharacterized protein (UPF0332 family)
VTDENRRANAAAELGRARECLREARALRDAGLAYGACSRAYYGVFHAARALLFDVGLETRSHRGLVGLLGEHFVRTGVLTPGAGRLVSRMQRDREDADYETGAVFTEHEAAQAVNEAEAFVAEASRVLGEPG